MKYQSLYIAGWTVSLYIGSGVKYQPLYSWVDSVVIDWEWREIPTLIYCWVDSVVIDWEWREIPILIYSWVDSVVIDWEWRKIPTLI